MKPYLGFGAGEKSPDRLTVRVFFIQAEGIEDALEVLAEMAKEAWDVPYVNSLTLLPPGDVPNEWVELFGGEYDDLANFTVRAGVSAAMVA